MAGMDWLARLDCSSNAAVPIKAAVKLLEQWLVQRGCSPELCGTGLDALEQIVCEFRPTPIIIAALALFWVIGSLLLLRGVAAGFVRWYTAKRGSAFVAAASRALRELRGASGARLPPAPHRFYAPASVTAPVVCYECFKPVLPRGEAQVCEYCGIVCHAACARHVPHDCKTAPLPLPPVLAAPEEAIGGDASPPHMLGGPPTLSAAPGGSGVGAGTGAGGALLPGPDAIMAHDWRPAGTILNLLPDDAGDIGPSHHHSAAATSGLGGAGGAGPHSAAHAGAASAAAWHGVALGGGGVHSHDFAWQPPLGGGGGFAPHAMLGGSSIGGGAGAGGSSCCWYCAEPVEVGLFAAEPVWRCSWCRRLAHVRCFVCTHPSAFSPETHALLASYAPAPAAGGGGGAAASVVSEGDVEAADDEDDPFAIMRGKWRGGGGDDASSDADAVEEGGPPAAQGGGSSSSSGMQSSPSAHLPPASGAARGPGGASAGSSSGALAAAAAAADASSAGGGGTKSASKANGSHQKYREGRHSQQPHHPPAGKPPSSSKRKNANANGNGNGNAASATSAVASAADGEAFHDADDQGGCSPSTPTSPSPFAPRSGGSESAQHRRCASSPSFAAAPLASASGRGGAAGNGAAAAGGDGAERGTPLSGGKGPGRASVDHSPQPTSTAAAAMHRAATMAAAGAGGYGSTTGMGLMRQRPRPLSGLAALSPGRVRELDACDLGRHGTLVLPPSCLLAPAQLAARGQTSGGGAGPSASGGSGAPRVSIAGGTTGAGGGSGAAGGGGSQQQQQGAGAGAGGGGGGSSGRKGGGGSRKLAKALSKARRWYDEQRALSHQALGPGRGKGGRWAGLRLETVRLPLGTRPILALVNVKSGPQVGHDLRRRLLQLLHPLQVVELPREGLSQALAAWVRVPGLRLLAFGGDGTAAWVLEALETLGMQQAQQAQQQQQALQQQGGAEGGGTAGAASLGSGANGANGANGAAGGSINGGMGVGATWRPPPLAVIPLGTGNDLARVLNWGGGLPEIMARGGLGAVLDDLLTAVPVRLDRWTVAAQEMVPAAADSRTLGFLSRRTTPSVPSTPSAAAAVSQQQLGKGSVSGAVTNVNGGGGVSGGPSAAGGTTAGGTAAGVLASLGAVVPPSLIPPGLVPKGAPALKAMNNYLGIGIDAQCAYGFHQIRERYPGWFQSQVGNKMWYTGVGAKDLLAGSSCADLPNRLTILADGVELRLPQGLQGILLLNIPSYMGGVDLWANGQAPPRDVLGPLHTHPISPVPGAGGSANGMQPPNMAVPSSSGQAGGAAAAAAAATTAVVAASAAGAAAQGAQQQQQQQGGSGHMTGSTSQLVVGGTGAGGGDAQQQQLLPHIPQPLLPPVRQAFNDGILELVGVGNAAHLGQLQVGIARAQRLCQARSITIVIAPGKSIPLQVDGEPWLQPPGVVTVTLKGSGLLLQRLDVASCPAAALAAAVGEVLDEQAARGTISAGQRQVLGAELARRLGPLQLQLLGGEAALGGMHGGYSYDHGLNSSNAATQHLATGGAGVAVSGVSGLQYGSAAAYGQGGGGGGGGAGGMQQQQALYGQQQAAQLTL